MAGGDKKKWRENFKKFLAFASITDQKSRTDVNVILDRLNAQDYTANLVADQNEIITFFNRGCSLIPSNKTNCFLLSKFFQLVERILVKQKILLDDGTLSNLIQHVIISAKSCPNISVYDHLKVLGELIYENGAKCAKFYEDMLGVEPTGLLLHYADCKNADIETQKAAITCIGNLCIKDLNGSFVVESYAETAMLTILNVLQVPPRKDVIKIEQCRLINTSLKAIQDILPSIRSLLKRHLGQLLLTIKNYIFFGFPGYELTFPNRATDSSTRDSSSDMEPDDLSILKLSLIPVKERTFPGRRALRKKSRHKRGKPRKEEKNDEKFDDDVVSRENNFIHQSNPSSAISVQNSFSLREHEAKSESMNTPLPTGKVLSWRERDLDQEQGVGDLDTNSWARPSSSESEFSDTESGQARRLRSTTAKVRNSSLVCLQNLIKNSDKKDLFGFWSSFISDGSGALTWSLFTVIQSDPNFKNRTGAASVLMDLLDGSKQFLAAADDSEMHHSSSRPFTPFSSRLGSMVHELHRLLDLIPNETSASTQVQLVKCMAVLVLNCPYHKLQSGLLSKVVKTIKPLLAENDTEVVLISDQCQWCNLGQGDLILKQSTLVCFGAVLTVNAPMSEVVRSMEDSQNFTQPLTSEKRTLQSNDGTTFPWLVEECFHILKNFDTVSKDVATDDTVSNLRSEVLHLLIVFTRNYFNVLRPVISELGSVARGCLRGLSPVVAVSAIKLLQELGRMMCQTIYTDDNNEEKILVREFWLHLLSGEILGILQSRDPLNNKCKAAACDCFSDIGAHVLEELPFDKRILVITMLLGLANDEDSSVKAAAVRALGVYIVYPFLREDTVFVTDTASAIINCLDDSSLLVRIRAAWSLANLSDAFVMNRNSKNGNIVGDFSEASMLRLINVALKASEDNEKVKCNIVRALGNFAKYLSQDNIAKQCFSEAVENIVHTLTKCILAGQMKTRWNACYAAGNVFGNSTLPTGKTTASIQMFDALLSVVSSCKNFKVRINAVNSLAVPVSRSCYGDEKQFAKLWSCLAETLSSTENISDFSEFKYRDTLREQILATICHVSTLVATGDLKRTNEIVTVHQQDLIKHLTSFYQNEMKNDEDAGSELLEQTTNQPSTTLFVRAYDHIMATTDVFTSPLRTVFDQAKKAAEELMQPNIE